jgi:hypothetical protein
MAATSVPTSAGVGAGQAFLGDARLALTALNQARYYALNRAFGVSREQANLLTFVIALGVTEASVETARRVVRAPFPLTRGDAIFGGLLMREAGSSLAGPAARAVPGFGALVAVAMVGGVAVPGLRRAIRGARSAEHRIRQQRLAMYNAARTAAEQVRGAVGAEG